MEAANKAIVKDLEASFRRYERHNLVAWFARVNWLHHSVPTVRATLDRFRHGVVGAGGDTIFLTLLSEAYTAALVAAPEKEAVWGDAITVYFGGRAVPVRPIAERRGRISVLSERGAQLNFYNGTSGSVAAVISPPSSTAQSSSPPDYLVEIWRNPLHMRERDVQRLLYLALDVHLSCGAATFPNPTGVKLLDWLAKRHQSYQSSRRGLFGKLFGWLVGYGRTAGAVYHTHALYQLVPNLASIKAAILAISI